MRIGTEASRKASQGITREADIERRLFLTTWRLGQSRGVSKVLAAKSCSVARFAISAACRTALSPAEALVRSRAAASSGLVRLGQEHEMNLKGSLHIKLRLATWAAVMITFCVTAPSSVSSEDQEECEDVPDEADGGHQHVEHADGYQRVQHAHDELLLEGTLVMHAVLLLLIMGVERDHRHLLQRSHLRHVEGIGGAAAETWAGGCELASEQPGRKVRTNDVLGTPRMSTTIVTHGVIPTQALFTVHRERWVKIDLGI